MPDLPPETPSTVRSGTPGDDRIRLGGGSDAYDGGDGDDRIQGGGGDDYLAGGAQADHLFGEAGDDALRGGGHNDHLDGGSGSDTALYSELWADVRIDLASGRASFPGRRWRDEALVSIENAVGGSGNDTLLGDAARNRLWGMTGDDIVRGGGNGDRLYGGEGDDELYGDDGRDRLYGGAGDDRLHGGGHNDLFAGGRGSDTAVFDEVIVDMTLDLAEGRAAYAPRRWQDERLASIEHAETGSGDDMLVGSRAANVLRGGDGADALRGGGGDDRLEGGGGNDILSGGRGDDRLEGGGGRDRLHGGAGDDVLDGGGWNDRIDGGPGLDTVLYQDNDTSVRVDLGRQRVSFPDKGWPAERVASVENATTGSGDDELIGDDGANVLQGGEGDDILGGGGGDDVLSGGSLEQLVFPAYEERPPFYVDGADVLDGGAGVDTVVYGEVLADGYSGNYRYWGEAPDLTVDLAAGRATSTHEGFGTDRMASIENVVTGSGTDLIRGTSADNDLRSGDGFNKVEGRGGDDTIHGGTYHNDSRSNQFGDGTYAGNYADLLFGGSGDDTIHANGCIGLYYYLADWVDASPGIDYLNGGRGSDHLVAGIGNQDMIGGAGADTFHFRDEQRTLLDLFGYDRAVGQNATIEDFRPEEGDRLVFEIAADHDGRSPRYVGEQNIDESDVLELGYTIETDDDGSQNTVLSMKFEADDPDGDLQNDYVVLEVVLLNYSEALSEDYLSFA